MKKIILTILALSTFASLTTAQEILSLEKAKKIVIDKKKLSSTVSFFLMKLDENKKPDDIWNDSKIEYIKTPRSLLYLGALVYKHKDASEDVKKEILLTYRKFLVDKDPVLAGSAKDLGELSFYIFDIVADEVKSRKKMLHKEKVTKSTRLNSSLAVVSDSSNSKNFWVMDGGEQVGSIYKFSDSDYSATITRKGKTKKFYSKDAALKWIGVNR